MLKKCIAFIIFIVQSIVLIGATNGTITNATDTLSLEIDANLEVIKAINAVVTPGDGSGVGGTSAMSFGKIVQGDSVETIDSAAGAYPAQLKISGNSGDTAFFSIGTSELASTATDVGSVVGTITLSGDTLTDNSGATVSDSIDAELYLSSTATSTGEKLLNLGPIDAGLTGLTYSNGTYSQVLGSGDSIYYLHGKITGGAGDGNNEPTQPTGVYTGKLYFNVKYDTSAW